MLMNRDLIPELCASKDETRFHICSLHLDVERKCLVATDGHRMITVPVTPEEGDHTGAITLDALKHARKVAKSMGKSCEVVQIKANGAQVCADGTTFKRPDVRFPPYQQVIPSYRRGADGTITIALNAAYLADIAKALDATMCGVELTIMPSQEALDPIVVKASRKGADATAVLMPCRLYDPNKKK